MPERPSNSRNDGTPRDTRATHDAPDPDEKVIEPVVSGNVKRHRRSIFAKVKDSLFGDDAKDVATYVLTDVLLPSLRDMMVDMTKNGIERLVYGDQGPRRRPGFQPHTTSSRVSYSSYSRGASRPTTSHTPRTRTREEPNGFILESRDEALLVLERMNDIIEMYGVATMADLLELMRMPSTHVDSRWGWDREIAARIRHTRDGYLLDMPSADPV